MSATGFGLAAAPPSTNIYVHGLPKGIDEEKLREVFSAYGDVTWCKILRETRDGKVPGLVEFSSLEHSSWVVQNVNGGVPQGLTEPVDVKFKDERGSYGKGDYGYGRGGWSQRYSPYGLSDTSAVNDEQYFFQMGAQGCCANYGNYGAYPQLSQREPQANQVPGDNVYVRGLPADADEALLRTVFSVFGVVAQCRVCPGGPEAKKSALVRFQTVEEATHCVTNGTNQVLPPLKEPVELCYAETWDRRHRRGSDGTEFSIEVVVKGFENSGLMPGGVARYDNKSSFALYIAGLPPDTTDYHLYRMFSPLGPISPRGVRALLNEDGTCKGIAFVNFQREESLQIAIATYHGASLPDGGRLRVQQKQASKPQAQVCHPPAAPLNNQQGPAEAGHEASGPSVPSASCAPQSAGESAPLNQQISTVSDQQPL